MKKQTPGAKAAFCGVFSALCLALMLVSSFLPALTYTMPAMSGIILLVIALSMDARAGWLVYICVSFLSLLFVSDKECALLFTAFFGYYPILKLKLDGMRRKVLRALLKLLLFNSTFLLSQLILIYLFHIPVELIEGLGMWTIPLLVALANILFVCYDIMLAQLRRAYCLKWHKYVERLFKF